MKYRLGLILFAGFTLSCTTLWSQDTSSAIRTTVRFKVNGACDMCEERIEKSLQRKGVWRADWNPSDQYITIVFDAARVPESKLHQWISEAGHDTELRKARNTAYESLPECCRYRDPVTVAHGVPVSPTNAFKPDSLADLLKNDHLLPPKSNVIRGIVLSIDSKGNFEPLRGATVHWLGLTDGVLTDAQGIFRIPVLENHRKLEVSFTGFRPDTIAVVDDQDIRVVLATGKQLQAVEVTGRSRTTLVSSMTTLRTQVMTEKELFKAACCNLSESFETNPSVDVSYNDAVTGSKQIQLLGLSGNYSMLTLENMPGPRGLATPMGLNYVPGPWVESIQISKGVGSVANGFESISGQINVELKKPEKAEPLYANMYVNDMGKVDLNLDLTRKINRKWSTALLLHDNFLNNANVDFNKDGFRDVPTGNLFTVLNRWRYDDLKGFMVQFGFKYLTDQKTGGTTDFNPSRDKYSLERYGMGVSTKRMEGFLKVGYVFPGKKYKSIGGQVAAFDHDQDAYFGIIPYAARQQNLYANLIYQSIISNTAHKFRTGLSYVSDRYRESYGYAPYNRTEQVPGAFFEYTYTFLDKFSLVAGVRSDRNNLFGWFVTPRLHLRYEPVKGTVIRVASGRGQRTANIFAEYMGVMNSARQFVLPLQSNVKAYGLNPEIAWNSGITVDQRFGIGNRNGNISIDYYYTHFTDQVIADMENPRSIRFYNLEGRSFSSSFQAEVNYELLPKLELRLAWRYYQVKTTYGSSLLDRPLLSRNRAFVNLAWERSRWKFDLTANSNGTKRIPPTNANPNAYQVPERSPAYVVMNAQVTRTLGKKKAVDCYLGVENLTNYFQRDLIVAASEPFGNYFDASLVWGPVYGRMFYSGIRWKIK